LFVHDGEEPRVRTLGRSADPPVKLLAIRRRLLGHVPEALIRPRRDRGLVQRRGVGLGVEWLQSRVPPFEGFTLRDRCTCPVSQVHGCIATPPLALMWAGMGMPSARSAVGYG